MQRVRLFTAVIVHDRGRILVFVPGEAQLFFGGGSGRSARVALISTVSAVNATDRLELVGPAAGKLIEIWSRCRLSPSATA